MSLTNSGAADALFWWAYLLGLVAISFISGTVNMVIWQWFAVALYCLVAVYLLAAACGIASINIRALVNARMVCACLAATLVWLLLQRLLPDSEVRLLSAAIVDRDPAPDWFTPRVVISIAPQKTQWLINSTALVFTWFCLTLSLLRTRQQLKQLMLVLALIGVAHALMAIGALKSGLFLVDKEQVDGHFSVARGWFINRNHFAAFIVLTLAAGFSYILRPSNAKNRAPRPAKDRTLAALKIFAAFQLVLILMALVLSQSRAGLLSVFAAGMVIYITAYLIGNRRSVSPTLVVGGMVLTVAVLFSMDSGMIERLQEGAFSIGERKTQWSITWQAISQAPVTGYGGGSYGTVFQAFRDHETLRQVIYNQSHNEYLHIWLEQGVIGLLIWLGLIFFTVQFVMQTIHKQRSSLVRAVMLACAIVCLAALLQAAVDFNLQVLNLRLYFFCLLAVLFVAPTIHQRQLANNSMPR